MEDRVGAHMDDALAFVPSGANLLEAVRGELNGDGIEYQLLVIDQPTPEGLVPGQHLKSDDLDAEVRKAFNVHFNHIATHPVSSTLKLDIITAVLQLGQAA